jgi:hypothetical protein
MSMTMPESGGHAATPPSHGPSVRAQILATEHWSLLATRSMTWSEVMSRIVIHLTVLSASLVVLALLAQANGFGRAFWVLSISLAGAALLLGTLTGLRVHNASADDMAMLLGMNRLRSAYIELDPVTERYLVTSRYDDAAGLMASYLMGNRRSTFNHVVASTGMFINVVNGLVAGTLGALVAASADAQSWLIAVIGTASGLVYIGAAVGIFGRMFSGSRIDSRFPTPVAPRSG